MNRISVSKPFSVTLVKDAKGYDIVATPSQLMYNPNQSSFVGGNSITFRALLNGVAYTGAANCLHVYPINSSGTPGNAVASGSSTATVSASPSFVAYNAVLTVNGVVVASVYVPINRYGDAGSTGQTGKLCYIVGLYESTVEYKSDSRATVAVEIETANSNKTELWYLDAATNVVNGTHIGPSDANQTIWKKALNDYNLIRTKYLFAEFGHLGALIVSCDYMFSQYGFWRDFDGETTAVNSISSNNPQYLLFDSSDPDGEDTDVTNNVRQVYNATTGQTIDASMSIAEISMVVKGTTAQAYYKAYLTKGRYTLSGVLESTSHPNGTVYIVARKGSTGGNTMVVGSLTDSKRVEKVIFAVTEEDWYYVSIYSSSSSDANAVTVDSVAIHHRKFVPNFYVDMLRGQVGLNVVSERASIPAKSIKYTVYTADTTEYLPTTTDSSVIAKYDTIVIPRNNSTADVTIWLETPNKAKGKKLTIYNISSRKVTIKANNNRGRSSSLQLPSYSSGWGQQDGDSAIENLHKLVLWCNGTYWYELEKLIRNASTGAVLSAFHTP